MNKARVIAQNKGLQFRNEKLNDRNRLLAENQRKLLGMIRKIEQLQAELTSVSADRDERAVQKGELLAEIDHLRKENIRLTRMSDARGKALDVIFPQMDGRDQDLIAEAIRVGDCPIGPQRAVPSSVGKIQAEQRQASQ